MYTWAKHDSNASKLHSNKQQYFNSLDQPDLSQDIRILLEKVFDFHNSKLYDFICLFICSSTDIWKLITSLITLGSF